ncbi:hypothetical protein Tsubulata_016759 [Turnera subulata]|uniref:Uncharacterized protein n=1 Tax=Turnera subulata TaxID=218843 RepID=A0A9Q0J551_9ROSI|nr:hypothetical protein Tsubulata_016759 [Turnera subulata]
MWQVLLAAAIAGSTGLVAKHFLSPTSPDPGPQWEQPIHSGGYHESNFEQGVFRFSSSASAGKKIRRNKSGTPSPPRRTKCAERSGGSGRRFAVRLKKRRKIAPKCGSPRSSSKDINLLGRGVGIGMMYMMSAGKAEISRLSAAMDETYKAVQELKTELYKRKSTQLAPGPKAIIDDHTPPLLHNQSSLEGRQLNSTKNSGLPVIEDVDCPSSVLTEEPEHEALEMDRLEAELESELQKLPWSTVEASGNEVRRPTLGKVEIASEGFHVLEGQTAVSYQSQGVSPSELDQKLCHLLIEQQENQIVGLESELNLAQAKILEKETELQALKDCVRRLTQFSLSTVSDDEAEQQTEQGCNSEWNSNSMVGFESRKSVVGMKRPIESA